MGGRLIQFFIVNTRPSHPSKKIIEVSVKGTSKTNAIFHTGAIICKKNDKKKAILLKK